MVGFGVEPVERGIGVVGEFVVVSVVFGLSLSPPNVGGTIVDEVVPVFPPVSSFSSMTVMTLSNNDHLGAVSSETTVPVDSLGVLSPKTIVSCCIDSSVTS
jgi:hypothetical protein